MQKKYSILIHIMQTHGGFDITNKVILFPSSLMHEVGIVKTQTCKK